MPDKIKFNPKQMMMYNLCIKALQNLLALEYGKSKVKGDLPPSIKYIRVYLSMDDELNSAIPDILALSRS